MWAKYIPGEAEELTWCSSDETVDARPAHPTFIDESWGAAAI
ncbi:protein of unknown function [Burkholderia multivorans]